jgi:formylglycine-generating enzyme required for sulfatase activity
MYQQCENAGVCRAPQNSSSYTRTSYYGASQFAEYPVIYVSWDDAVAYCAWAWRELPTEAQWEKAARGTDGRTYPWGEGIDASKANYNSNIGDTSAVGSYPAGASPYGAYDMAGNVWEWVADWYDSGYYSRSPDNNPTGPTSGEYRVLRGGGWDLNDYYQRSADRGNYDPTNRDIYVGFRCAAFPGK